MKPQIPIDSSILQESSLEYQSIQYDLDRMGRMDKELGYVSRQFTSIHIAGTNGKGSAATKLATTLCLAGNKVGLYTSPHIDTYHERIQLNGMPIKEERAAAIVERLQPCMIYKPSYFELMTILAFYYFAEEKVDVAVIETGLGGRLDATNILVEPLLTVITSIHFDHMSYLGTTLAEIAYEKAGIIKPGVPLLLGPYAKPLSIFQERAEYCGSPLYRVEGSYRHYEEENQAIARQALSLLPFTIPPEALVRGVAAVPPCRFEIVRESDPLIILDVSHNPNGLERTFERIALLFSERPISVLAGFSADKDISTCLALIKQYASSFQPVYVDHPRLWREGEPLEIAYQKIYREAQEKGHILLITGSFFLMHRARELVSK